MLPPLEGFWYLKDLQLSWSSESLVPLPRSQGRALVVGLHLLLLHGSELSIQDCRMFG